MSCGIRQGSMRFNAAGRCGSNRYVRKYYDSIKFLVFIKVVTLFENIYRGCIVMINVSLLASCTAYQQHFRNCNFSLYIAFFNNCASHKTPIAICTFAAEVCQAVSKHMHAHVQEIIYTCTVISMLHTRRAFDINLCSI
jgi:hypothetical protein